MAHVLIVDDEPGLAKVLSQVVRHAGHSVEAVASGELAVDAMRRTRADLALVDISMPGLNGVETFTRLREVHPGVVGIFITAHGSIRSAVDAMRAGGFDYLTKPFDNDELLLAMERGLELRRLGEEVRLLREEIGSRLAFPGIVGRSPAMLKVLRLLPRVAASGATVLIQGESGTGKELVARSLHRGSPRASGPFVVVNCSTVPIALFESEFFGHERGAFTDAHVQHIGRLERAHRGTLFLDEIGELPIEAQAKLLRVLEDGEVTRLGGREPIPVDVRVVAASNRDLAADAAAGRFRQDLYWRLNVVTIVLPPLRERSEDLPLLVEHFVDRLNAEHGRHVGGLSPEAMARLAAHSWPGNIRELENTLRRAFVLAEGDLITPEDLSFPRWSVGAPAAAEAAEDATLAEAVSRATARVERGLIESTLARCHGNRTAAAQALGINRKTLFNRMRLYGLVAPDDPPDD
jgi:DNA-binding NtrC family response regulator